jgi:hypothetical protein
MSEECKSCRGTGRQVFHGPFDSVVGTCGFCKGSGARIDELRWYEDMPKKIARRRKEQHERYKATQEVGDG